MMADQMQVITMPKDGRLGMSRFGGKPGDTYLVVVEEATGKIVLIPSKVVPQTTIPEDVDELVEPET